MSLRGEGELEDYKIKVSGKMAIRVRSPQRREICQKKTKKKTLQWGVGTKKLQGNNERRNKFLRLLVGGLKQRRERHYFRSHLKGTEIFCVFLCSSRFLIRILFKGAEICYVFCHSSCFKLLSRFS